MATMATMFLPFLGKEKKGDGTVANPTLQKGGKNIVTVVTVVTRSPIVLPIGLGQPTLQKGGDYPKAECEECKDSGMVTLRSDEEHTIAGRNFNCYATSV